MFKISNSIIARSFFLNLSSGLLAIDLIKFSLCAGPSLYTCQGTKILKSYEEMLKTNCANCAKYFYCTGSYEAVYVCTNGDLDLRRKLAKKISDCGVEAQSISLNEDLEANSLGLNGGDCKSNYGCSFGCNPTCTSLNCDLKFGL
jgi:hypothetical protein